jgi:hypothetical protein
MNDERSIRSIGWREAIAAGSVVISLAFVAFEIHQNTAAVRAQTLQAISDNHSAIMRETFLRDDLEPLIARVFAGADRDDFTTDENGKLGAFYMIYLAHLENTYVQRNAGFIDDAVFASYGWRNLILTTKHFRTMVTSGQILSATVSPEFQQFFLDWLSTNPD